MGFSSIDKRQSTDSNQCFVKKPILSNKSNYCSSQTRYTKHYWWQLYLGRVMSCYRIKVGHIMKDNKIDLVDNKLFVH